MRKWLAKLGVCFGKEQHGGGAVETMAVVAAMVAIGLIAIGILGEAIKDRADVIQTQIESIDDSAFQNP